MRGVELEPAGDAAPLDPALQALAFGMELGQPEPGCDQSRPCYKVPARGQRAQGLLLAPKRGFGILVSARPAERRPFSRLVGMSRNRPARE